MRYGIIFFFGQETYTISSHLRSINEYLVFDGRWTKTGLAKQHSVPDVYVRVLMSSSRVVP